MKANQVKFWFLRRGETGVPGENLSVQSREPTNSTHIITPSKKKKKGHCLRARRPIRPALISGFSSIKRLGVFLLPLGWDASPSQGYPQHYAGTQLYTWVERGTVRVKCLAQEHNAMSPVRPRTQTTRSGVEPTNHEATVPPKVQCYK